MYNLLVGHSGFQANNETGQLGKKRVAVNTSFRRYNLDRQVRGALAQAELAILARRSTSHLDSTFCCNSISKQDGSLNRVGRFRDLHRPARYG